MSEHSGDRQTGSHESEEASDTDGGVDDSHGNDAGEAQDKREKDEHESADENASTGEDVSDELVELLAALDDGGVTARAIEDGIIDPQSVEPDEELRRQVEERSPGAVAEALAALGGVLARLDAEVREERERADDLESRLRRKQADFQNYKKRQKERMAQERERATENLVERLLDVRDNLERALETDESADIRGGIESTLAQFDRELERENVTPIEPQPGDTVDPVRHEVLATVPSGEAEDTIADVHRPGYEMAGKVLRPAQVTVSDSEESADEDTNGEGEESVERGDDTGATASTDPDSE